MIIVLKYLTSLKLLKSSQLNSTIEHLNASAIKINEDSIKMLGIALSIQFWIQGICFLRIFLFNLKIGSNNRMIRFDVSFNNIKNGGAVLFSRALSVDKKKIFNFQKKIKPFLYIIRQTFFWGKYIWEITTSV